MGTLSFADLDGDGDIEVLHVARLERLESLNPDLSTNWVVDMDGYLANSATVQTAGGVRIGTALTHTANLEVRAGDTGGLVSSVLLAGGRAFADLAAAAAAGARPGRIQDVVAAADLTGMGHPTFVVGSTDGYVYCVNATDASLDWAINLRAEPGSPIVGDVDADGLSEVIVAAGDGLVYAVGASGLEAPSTVFDTDGSFVASSPDEDLDELPSSSTVGANWSAVPGAAEYRYSILRDDDLIVVPWTGTGSGTRFARDDLALQLGRRYFVAVRAAGAAGSVSAETRSDGFVVIDVDAPDVMIAADPTLIHPGTASEPTSTRIDVGATDAGGLRSYRISVVDTGGVPVRSLAGGAIAGTRFSTSRTWDGRDDGGGLVPSGPYRVTATFLDWTSREGTASVRVLVCGADASSSADCTVTPADAGPDGPVDGGLPAGPWNVGGGGCNCSLSGARPSPHDSPAWLVIALLLFVARVRRRRT